MKIARSCNIHRIPNQKLPLDSEKRVLGIVELWAMMMMSHHQTKKMGLVLIGNLRSFFSATRKRKVRYPYGKTPLSPPAAAFWHSKKKFDFPQEH